MLDGSKNDGTSEAVGKLADSTRESFQALTDGAAATQRQSLSLMQSWIESPAGTIERSAGVFKEQVEINQRTMRSLAGQLERQQEALRVLALESSRMYAGLFFPPVSSRNGREADENGKRLPLEDYDELNVDEVAGRLSGLDAIGVERLRAYEKRHKNRKRLIERLDRSLV